MSNTRVYVEHHSRFELLLSKELVKFIAECFQTGGNRRFQIQDIQEWSDKEWPELAELRSIYGDELWFYAVDFLDE